MAYIAPITGHVDALGYARCVEHHNDTERQSIFAIRADNAAFKHDRCDRCGAAFFDPSARVQS